MEHKDDSDTDSNWCARYIHQKIVKWLCNIIA